MSGVTATFDGANPGDFTVSTAPASSVGSLDITRLIVHFSPTGTGFRTANLHIISNDSNEGSFDLTLSGNAVTPLTSFSDDFDPGIDTSLWADFSSSILANTNGQAAGSGSTGNSLWFGGADFRYATTMPINTSAGEVLRSKSRFQEADLFHGTRWRTEKISCSNIQPTGWFLLEWAVPIATQPGSHRTFRFQSRRIRQPPNFDFDRSVYEATALIMARSKMSQIGLPANTIEIDQPNGGEFINLSETTTITWGATITGNVRIELYKAGVFHSILASSETNDGSYDWLVSGSLPLGSDYRIRVSSVIAPGIEDFSDADFSIFSEVFPPGGNIPQGWITSKWRQRRLGSQFG